MDEIWGCVKYIGIPYETVMKMPVRQRKEWIRRHNNEQDNIKKKENNSSGSHSITGSALNKYAAMNQSMDKVMKKPK